ncbi:protein MpTRIHELIX9 [Marchantia polymorpha subsp. ruderalis]|nr:hypothetical protein AXG93_3036s1160 [Marchantia polymorpha subsp. ruderalis]PTQ46369.1 hypothetical protein MARPO_0011s0057 [Marchantia polymorpha]BBN08334.1 hypothetical protein Mp_4g10710 [Marchantia polymorpha subsp. ruderalis]|eukprot:PTQ46369.1 hypothetical protein MARPO_0011s0057 [Marchantia polymorpha]
MKPGENVWDAIAADLAAVTAATNGSDEIADEDIRVEVQKVKIAELSHTSDSLELESGVNKSHDCTGKIETNDLHADGISDSGLDCSSKPLLEGAHSGVKVGDELNVDSLLCQEEASEAKDDYAQNVVETLTCSTEEDANNHSRHVADEEKKGKEDKGGNILGKRNRKLNHRATRSSGKKLKLQAPVNSDAGDISHRDKQDVTISSEGSLSKAQNLQKKPEWNEADGANIHSLPELEKLQRVFTSLNTACGYLLKQQKIASWENVKQAMKQLSGADSETISVDDVRRLSQLCPQIVVLSQFSGEGEDISFQIELFDPADGVKLNPPNSSNGSTAVDAHDGGTSKSISAGKKIGDSEARVIVESRQKAFQMSLAQVAHQFQAPQSTSVSVGGDEHLKHPKLPHPAMLRHPTHEGRHSMVPALIGPPAQQLVLPRPPLLPQQLQHSYVNMSDAYPGLPFPLPFQPTNGYGPFGSFPQPQCNNYAGYQLSNHPSSIPSSSQLSSMPMQSNVPHRSPSTTIIPLPIYADTPEAPSAPEPSPYHGLSLNKAKRRRSRNWDTWEVILLVQAKKYEWERSECSSGKDRVETSGERWKKVEKFLKENKVVDRDGIACKNKWEAILSDYKSIKDWNRKPGNTVYSLLSPAEKKAANLPAVFVSSLLELMDTFQGKACHISPPSVLDPLGKTNPAVSGGDASRAEEHSGEAHPSAHGNGTHGSAGRRKKPNGGWSPLVAAFDRLSANMLNIEKGRDERSERLWALENRKYDLEKNKYELQARKVDAEREDRKGLVRVLGNLAGAFHRMADKM